MYSVAYIVRCQVGPLEPIYWHRIFAIGYFGRAGKGYLHEFTPKLLWDVSAWTASTRA